MGKFNYNLYTAISSMTQENLHQSLKTFLTKRYGEDKVVEMEEHFLFAIGNIPICLVAHLDTVHKRLPHDIFFDQSKNVIWSPQGLGADDRAGVYDAETPLQSRSRGSGAADRSSDPPAGGGSGAHAGKPVPCGFRQLPGRGCFDKRNGAGAD